MPRPMVTESAPSSRRTARRSPRLRLWNRGRPHRVLLGRQRAWAARGRHHQDFSGVAGGREWSVVPGAVNAARQPDYGRGGIRTHGTRLTYTHFPGVRLKPRPPACARASAAAADRRRPRARARAARVASATGDVAAQEHQDTRRPAQGTPYSAHTHAARTIGAQSIGVRSRPCQALNCVLSRYGCRLPSPGRIPISWISSEIISVPTTAAALLRVTADSSSPMHTIARDRDQVHEQADVHELERLRRRDDRARQALERVESRLDAARRPQPRCRSAGSPRSRRSPPRAPCRRRSARARASA